MPFIFNIALANVAHQLVHTCPCSIGLLVHQGFIFVPPQENPRRHDCQEELAQTRSVCSVTINHSKLLGWRLFTTSSITEEIESLSFSIGFSPSGAIFQTGGIDKPGSAIFLPEKLGGNIRIMSYGHNSHLTNPNNSNLTKTGESYTDDDDPDYVYQSEDFSEDDSDFHPVNIDDEDLSEGYVTGLQFCHI
jgi:hypothetical protein